ncbi:hypothetical protein GQ56_0128900 [Burkholderia paludis]|nr:hypothetical protein GQ56_0128900 [Burkholderia paludis]
MSADLMVSTLGDHMAQRPNNTWVRLIPQFVMQSKELLLAAAVRVEEIGDQLHLPYSHREPICR